MMNQTLQDQLVKKETRDVIIVTRSVIIKEIVELAGKPISLNY